MFLKLQKIVFNTSESSDFNQIEACGHKSLTLITRSHRPHNSLSQKIVHVGTSGIEYKITHDSSASTMLIYCLCGYYSYR